MKTLAAVIIGAVIIVAGGIVIFAKNDSKTEVTTKTASNDSTKATYGAVDACSVLTEAIASQVLGATPTKGDTTAGNVSSDSISVSNCTYFYKANSTGSILEQQRGIHTVSLLARAAKDTTGANSNQAQFAALPSGSQWVAGYGAKAYWNPKYGQLNILNNNNWYILSHYDGTSPTSGTLDQAKELADALANNLK
jgi:hypothetical protein